MSTLNIFLDKIFDFNVIHLTFGIFERLNFPSDFILPPLLLAILYSRNLNWELSHIAKSILLILVIFALFISYSRYLWAYSFLIIFFYFITTKITYQTIRYFFITSFILFIIILFNGESILNMIVERFGGRFAEASDLPRLEMKQALFEMIETMPFTGWGMGAFSDTLIRFKDSPWNYELQWMTFFMQFGYIGIVYLLFLLSFIYKTIFLRMTIQRFVIGIGFSLWLITGFFNCFLLTSSAGVVFLFYYILADNLNFKKDINVKKNY